MLDLSDIEILQVAIAHEGRARRFYERLASRHGGTPEGDLFDFLAGEEEGHIRKLVARYGVPAFEAEWDAKYFPYLIDLDRLAREERAEAEGASGPGVIRKGFEIARKAEEHAVSFYGAAGRVASDRSTRELLLELEGEERIHLARIESYLKGV